MTESSPFDSVPKPENDLTSSKGSTSVAHLPPPPEKAKVTGPLSLFFFCAKDQIEKDIKFVLEKSATAKVVGMKHAHKQAGISHKMMNDASEAGVFIEAGKFPFQCNCKVLIELQ